MLACINCELGAMGAMLLAFIAFVKWCRRKVKKP